MPKCTRFSFRRWLLIYIDTHAHLSSLYYGGSLSDIIDSAKAAGVSCFICPGCDAASSQEAKELSEQYTDIYWAAGYHPHEAENFDNSFFSWLRSVATHDKLVAVGEIGLDYHYDYSPRDVQRRVFADHIGIAKELSLPIVVHDREAHKDTLDILISEGKGEITGVLHCFSGSREFAKDCLDMGFYISFAGPVTFSNASKLRDAASMVPLDRILAETDSPYLTPVPFRGKQNEPKHVLEVYKVLASVKEMPLGVLAAAIADNAAKLFKIPTNA